MGTVSCAAYPQRLSVVSHGPGTVWGGGWLGFGNGNRINIHSHISESASAKIPFPHPPLGGGFFGHSGGEVRTVPFLWGGTGRGGATGSKEHRGKDLADRNSTNTHTHTHTEKKEKE